MKALALATDNTYYNLHTLSEYSVGDTLIVHNTSSDPIFLTHNVTQPAFSSPVKETVAVGDIVLVNPDTYPVWVAGTTGPIIVQRSTERLIAPFTGVDLPHDLMTSNTQAFRRIRVDVGQTGLYEGREFRLVRKISVPLATPLVYRFTSTVDFILFEQELNTTVGDIELRAWRDIQGTPTGTFSTVVPTFGKNISNTYRLYDDVRYVSQVTVSTGGGFTPTDVEAYVDYDRAKTSGATAQQSSVSGGDDSARYLAAGTYYLVLESLDATSVGRFQLAWEERPQQVVE